MAAIMGESKEAVLYKRTPTALMHKRVIWCNVPNTGYKNGSFHGTTGQLDQWCRLGQAARDAAANTQGLSGLARLKAMNDFVGDRLRGVQATGRIPDKKMYPSRKVGHLEELCRARDEALGKAGVIGRGLTPVGGGAGFFA